MSLDTDNDTHESAGALALAFACGILTGAALGLLLAPAHGRHTRAWVAAHGRSARRGTSELLTRNRLIAIVRQEGVRGLLHHLQAATADRPNGARDVTSVA